MIFSLIVAYDQNRGIGLNGTLPWRIPADLAHFKSITTKTAVPSKRNAVIMGRVTWESLPPSFKPLPNRLNIVLSHQTLALPEGVLSASSLEAALSLSASQSDIESVFIIGGGKLYQNALQHPDLKTLYITQIHGIYDCDTFFPEIPDRFLCLNPADPLTEGTASFTFLTYQA